MAVKNRLGGKLFTYHRERFRNFQATRNATLTFSDGKLVLTVRLAHA